jgi:hypothetical protein
MAATKTGRPAARSTRSRLPGVPDFDIKQDAALAAHGQAGPTPGAEPQAAAPEAKPAEPAAPPKLVPVPAVIGKFKINAEKILKQQGFKVSLHGKKVGRVTAQSPNANARVAPGSEVTITIGK